MNLQQQIETLREKRVQRIIAMHARGKSLREIGAKVGLSYEGVRLIVKQQQKARQEEVPAE
jgi:DNA-binding CsgD family transcriptional regulator